MPITINGSGTVTGITPGGLPDGSITTDDLAANAVTTPKLGTNEASGLAKAWVNFNGTGTVAIRAQYNVSSITDNGTGDYTVNFATAMVDANYANAVTGSRDNTNFGYSAITVPYLGSQTTTAVRLLCYPGTAGDYQYISYQAFR
jgi:hypothetical protein